MTAALPARVVGLLTAALLTATIAVGGVVWMIDRRLVEDPEGLEELLPRAVKIVAAKHFAVTNAWTVVDTALDVAGGSGVFRRKRLEQLFRDARLGRVHPANRLAAYEIVGKASLGVADDDGPRWG